MIRKNQSVFRGAVRILDRAMDELYFASGAYPNSGDGAEVCLDISASRRFLRELGPTLSLMAQVPDPSIGLRLLETLEYLIPVEPRRVFFLMASAVLRGGDAGGYQLHGLAAELFVRSVQRYIADYRNIFLRADDDIRGQLLDALDYVVGAGWPSARRLAYEVAEMVR